MLPVTLPRDINTRPSGNREYLKELLGANGPAARSRRSNRCNATSLLLVIVFLASVLGLALVLKMKARGQRRASVLPSLAIGRTTMEMDVLPGIKRLVIVACHSVFIGSSFLDARSPESWYLENYQQAPGHVDSFMEHIRVGVEMATNDPSAMLMFSGGRTRAKAGPRSEATSYWLVADAQNWFGESEVKQRAYTEEQARDSFENLLFSLCRFRQLTHRYPEHIMVISYDFKTDRFVDFHRTALRIPHGNFQFLGTDNPRGKQAMKGEMETLSAFAKDPYGCFGILRDKKFKRDPFKFGGPSPESCPELAGVLHYCSPKIYKERVPWDVS